MSAGLGRTLLRPKIPNILKQLKKTGKPDWVAEKCRRKLHGNSMGKVTELSPNKDLNVTPEHPKIVDETQYENNATKLPFG